MATVWFLFAVLCIATAAPAVKGGKQGVAMVKSEAVPVLAVTFTISSTAVVPKTEEADVALRQIEEELKQKEGVLKEVVMAAAPSEKAMKEVGEPLVEHTNELQDPQSEKPEAQAVFCPDGWFDHDGRCFTLTHSALDWNSAEDHCKSLGGHLASIHNPEDNRFLKQLVTLGGQNDVWIGSYFLQTRWRWIDGTGMYYQDFITTSSSTSSACTCLRSSGWAKASCSSNMRFICSTSPGSC
ncbi:type-2 ice-structuring protein-like isoform X1 [Gadus macrocephalus]|uniref:type-2 ice-structuring protein-like isoform X1 n=1 Tax=Gadus macrocephalus TaxID=80720 RepID=UPI0028CB9D37|nr:type-2 ice-structuring protein-like isoform X1 [Gadus macrocephalus]